MSTTLNITRGDDYNLPILVESESADGTKTPIDITGGTVYLTVKEKETISDTDNTDTTAIFQVVVTNHVNLTTVSTFIPISSTNTNKLKKSEKYVYDIQLTDVAGKRTTLVVPAPIALTLDSTRS